MSCNGVVKENPRIISKDIYKYISANSSLSREQVKECFDVYRDMLVKLYTDENCDMTLQTYIPNIGKFHLVKRKGRKEGIEYTIPTGWKDKILKKCTTKKSPSFYMLRFDVNNSLYNSVKEATSFYEEE